MDYKVDDEFLNSVDRLLDSVMEMSQHSDPMTASGIALVDLKRFEAVRDNAVRVCDLIEDGFPDCEERKDDENGSESETETEEGSDPGDDDSDAVHLDPDCDGSGFVAY